MDVRPHWDICTMRHRAATAQVEDMTNTSSTLARAHSAWAPLSHSARIGSGLALILGAALIAVPQYVEYLLAGDLEREAQIAWGLQHQTFYRLEWVLAMFGSFLLVPGFLGIWHITRHQAPRLTAVGAVVLLWGLAGQVFSDVATYTAQVVAGDVFGAADAERLIADGYLEDPGMIGGVLVPVIVGMLVGILVTAAACWRSGFPKAPVAMLALWPLWDFLGPTPLGPFTTDLLLLGAGVWLGLLVVRGRELDPDATGVGA